ncbi:Saposin-like type B, region 1 family protein [Histomonas meleagridis]|uniref:Saposin-like type B, region 1 family protein n=1 Tax=Histomonas meleagridis TaxID=135588 RepID=UPI003559805E|nr:Saposin-like type B, region 1 family protein [Histomonas meleagridis]KAH0799802.1 Saposin-like type B, region 1 family protein [Histomonas meleagridis]
MFALLLACNLCYEDVKPIEVPAGLTNTDACAVCTTVISGITNIMDNTKIQTAIAQLAAEICKKFKNNAAQNLCKTIIAEYLPKVISWVSKGISQANICNKLGLCTSNDEDDELVYINIPEGLENGIGCSICKHLISGIVSIIKSTTVESKIMEQAEKICARFPKIGRDFCDKIVQYIPTVINYIAEGLNNAEICVKINICTSNDNNDDAYLQLYLEMDDDDYITEMELPLGLSNADNCAICQKAVGFISKAMGNSLIQKVVSSAATAACGVISSGVGVALCKAIVGAAVGPIMSWLGQKLSKSAICTKLKYCSGNNRPHRYDYDIEEDEDDDDEIIFIEIPSGIDNGTACTVCKTVINGIVTIMKDTSVTSQIAALAANLCTKLPASVQSICSTIINNYLTKVISWLGSGLSSLDVCGKLNLC